MILFFLTNSVIPPSPSIQNDLYTADIDCSGHYAGINSTQNTIATNPISVLLPNGGSMISTHIQSLNISSLPPKACTQHLFPAMKTSVLLSIVQLCDHGYTASFSKYKLYIKNKHTGQASWVTATQRQVTRCGWLIYTTTHQHPKYAMISSYLIQRKNISHNCTTLP